MCTCVLVCVCVCVPWHSQVRAKRDVRRMQQEALSMNTRHDTGQLATDRAVQLRLGRHRRVKSVFWIVFEACHCALMFTAMVLLFVYVFQLNQTARLKDR